MLIPFNFIHVRPEGQAEHITKRPNFKGGWRSIGSKCYEMWVRLKQFWEPN